MFIGTRVVRGPNWPGKDQDGGEGCVGTIVDQSESGDKTVSVIWDMGRNLFYKAGNENFQLRIFDNAQTGVDHPYCKCISCNTEPISGMRWICLDCVDINLCTECYMNDKHNIGHIFGRLTEPISPIFKLPTRKSSKKMMCLARGLFQKAKVMRGPHWEWRDTDGGEGAEGTIMELGDWSNTSRRSTARVQWKKRKNVETYRVGAEGRVDLIFTEPGKGYQYYKEHLPVLDVDFHKKIILKIGDKVRIDLTKQQLNNVQMITAGGIDDAINPSVNDIGTVVQIIVKGLVRVQYQNGSLYSINQILLSKVHSFQKDDLIRVLSDKKTAVELQQGHGGWSEKYDKTLGELGHVVNIDEDGDISVLIDKRQYLFSPVCLDFINQDEMQKLPEQKLFEQTEYTPKPGCLVLLASEGKAEDVQELLLEDPSEVDEEEDGVTALQIACKKGYEEIVKYLISANADLDKSDKNGDTPLHYSVLGKKPVITRLLLRNGAKVDLVNKEGYTPLHYAVDLNLPKCVRHLVNAKCDVHIKGPSGETAVHEAIRHGKERVIQEIFEADCIRFDEDNFDGFDVLQWATLKNCKIAVEKIIDKDQSVVNRPIGNTPLHIAVSNNHRDLARILLTKGKANVNAVDILDRAPLNIAVTNGNLPMVELLLEHDADPNTQDKFGNGPLHITQIQSTVKGSDDENNWANFACLLIEYGADLNLRNKEGKSTLDLAPALSRAYLLRISKTAHQRRQDKKGAGGIYLPLHWKDMGTKTLINVSLDQKNPIEKSEYKSIKDMFLKGLPKRQIRDIVRVQNKFLWEHYSVKKRQFVTRLGKGNEREVSLFHGTKSETVLKICTENFDFRIAGVNVGTMYGRGIYFATEPSLSDCYCEEDNDGLRHMLLAKVLAGKVTYGSQELTKPPDGYDCVVDYTEHPRIYCVFDFNQCYPEYIIKYK